MGAKRDASLDTNAKMGSVYQIKTYVEAQVTVNSGRSA